MSAGRKGVESRMSSSDLISVACRGSVLGARDSASRTRSAFESRIFEFRRLPRTHVLRNAEPRVPSPETRACLDARNQSSPCSPTARGHGRRWAASETRRARCKSGCRGRGPAPRRERGAWADFYASASSAAACRMARAFFMSSQTSRLRSGLRRRNAGWNVGISFAPR